MKEKPSFEVAYKRLEVILEKMNSGNLGLDESLTLYEEADQLINLCTKMLDAAERKIKIMIKNRAGKTELDEDGSPLMEDFESSTQGIIH